MKSSLRIIVSILAVATLGAFGGCVVAPNVYGTPGYVPGGNLPIVDTQGVDYNRYVADQTECNAYAQQVNPGGSAVAGAAGGALLGGALSAVTGGHTRRNVWSAAGGAVVGAAVSAGSALAQQRVISQRCMAGRGYRVLG